MNDYPLITGFGFSVPDRVRDNHYLDCEKLNAAAAHYLHLNRLTTQSEAPKRKIHGNSEIT